MSQKWHIKLKLFLKETEIYPKQQNLQEVMLNATYQNKEASKEEEPLDI